MKVSKNPPGTLNKRALLKVALIMVWLVVPATAGAPLMPLNYAYEWGQDVSAFAENNTTWWGLSEWGRTLYVLFPIPWIVVGLAWYEIWFRTRRKRLIVNGQEDGVVMLITGDPNHKQGHLYDLVCVLNGFRHISWGQFPRPILGKDYPPGVTIYYRSRWLVNPLRWEKLSVRPRHITYGFHTMWVDGTYRTRVRHHRRPVLDYEILSDEQHYQTELLEYEEFVKAHRHTQETIMKDNYRMTVSEPGTAKNLVRSSMMTIADETKNEYLDLMPSEVRAKYLEHAMEGSDDFVGPAQVGE